MERIVDARTRVLQEESLQKILATHCEPTKDIIEERKRSTFPVAELQYYLNGGRENVEKKIRFANLVSKTDWGDKSQRYFLSREEEYVGGLKAAFGIWDLMRKNKLSVEDGAMIRSLVDWPGGLELHIGMFIPSIIGLCTPEQQAKWLPMAQKVEIIGTYAQTELGHGTFVRGLETTATYDPDRQEFILHSPTTTSTKWWPGGMAKTATHAVVMARLFIRGKDYGPHGFMVQLRDLEDHKPMPGITVGDIGPKFGYNGVDNGFLRFEYVRIPREDMLMRFTKVTPEGDYVPPPPSNTKSTYATMLYVRATIVEASGRQLMKASTIAVRYAAVRRQTAASPGEIEKQVLDYQNVSGTLLPIVASTYALHFTGKTMMAMYHEFERNRDQGVFSTLPELHALSSGLKAFCTGVACEGVEKCRLSAGGHGYSRLSAFPDLYGSYVQNATWEGDNNVLYLQTGRFLVKALGTAMSGKPLSGTSKYLENARSEMGRKCAITDPGQWLDTEAQLAAFRHRALRLVAAAAEDLKNATGGQPTFQGDAWDNNTLIVIKAATAHSLYFVYKNFLESVAQIEVDGTLSPPTRAALRSLLSLFALTYLDKESGDFMEYGYMTPAQVKMIRTQQKQILRGVRENAVALVDAFGLLDYELNSALGRADGDVYKSLFEMAQGSPLNKTEEGPAWREVLEPRMKARSRM